MPAQKDKEDLWSQVYTIQLRTCLRLGAVSSVARSDQYAVNVHRSLTLLTYTRRLSDIDREIRLCPRKVDIACAACSEPRVRHAAWSRRTSGRRRPSSRRVVGWWYVERRLECRFEECSRLQFSGAGRNEYRSRVSLRFEDISSSIKVRGTAAAWRG